MPYELHNRHFLKLLDFSPQEIRFLLDLSRDFKKAKYAGTEQTKLKGKNINHIMKSSKTSRHMPNPAVPRFSLTLTI